jgi:anti-sigma regulatory factor (Ser/Thr protein kinase)
VRRARAEQVDAPFDDYVGRRAATFRRRLTAVAVLAVAAVIAVSAGLAWREYTHAQRSARNDLRSRVVIAAAVINASFAGDVSTLEAVANSPAFVDQDRSRMQAYLRRLRPEQRRLFNAGLGWADSSGVVSVSTSAATSAVTSTNVASRTYFKRVLATGQPYVSGGLVGVTTHQPLVVIAVPTRNAQGAVSGMLLAGIRLTTVGSQKSELELGYTGLAIVDRSGRLLLSGLERVKNTALLAKIGGGGTGVATGTAGLDRTGNDVVAYSTAAIPAWRIVIDRSRSSVYAAARRSFILQLGSLVGAAILVLAICAFVLRRSRRERSIQEARARAWSGLTRALTAAATPDDVAAALVGALAAAFPESLALVTFETVDGAWEVRTPPTQQWQRIASLPGVVDEVARRAMARRQSVLIDRVPELEPAFLASGRRLRALHCMPMDRPNGDRVGGLALVRPFEWPLEESEWALLASFAEQAAQAFERSRRSEHDHDLAIQLQRSLLPDALPVTEGVDLTGHYRAGGAGVEVGGDWYDAVRRPDGIVHLCVGDVIGRGIGAATLMGRHRNAFRAYAYECVSPGEIMRRLIRHVVDEEMVTVACVALDPLSGELAYSCAGHPPPLLVEDGKATRLDRASSPPIGVAEPASILEATLPVGEHMTLVLYSDGLIERRGENLDTGIDLLGSVATQVPDASVEDVLERVTAALGAPVDDVALLIARLTGEPIPFEIEFSSDPSELPEVRRRLRCWLDRRHVAPADADDIVLAIAEACNNAVEHAYDHDQGRIRLQVDEDGEVLRATLRDEGQWRPGEQDGDRGRGLLIMHALMQVADIKRTPGGTEVVLERRLARRNGNRRPAHV